MASMTLFVLNALLLLLAAYPSTVHAEEDNLMLPMRDGIKLNTLVDTPLGVATPADVIFDRSPYGIWALDAVALIYLLLENYVAVRQSLRGTQLSEGEFKCWLGSGNDSYDTSVWIAQQPWATTQQLLSIGGSADGIAALFDVIAQPATPLNLKAQFLIFCGGDARNMVYPGGAFQKALVEFWLTSTVPDQAPALIQELKDSENWDGGKGAFWANRSVQNSWKRATWPAVFWGGWYDVFLKVFLWTYESSQALSGAAGQHKLVIDPLGHCQDGSKYFPDDLIAGRSLLPILWSIDLFKNPQNASVPENVKRITFYVMGPYGELFSRGNHWTTMDDFPTFVPTRYYMNLDRSLTTTPPQVSTGNVTYQFDPANPVKTIGGNNLPMGGGPPCGPLDQTPVEEGNRTDVLTFTSEVLSSDVWITGPIDAIVYVSTTAVDTDFTVKVTDVYADGTSRLIQDGIVRGRWSCGTPCVHGSDTPHLLTPNKVYPMYVSLTNSSYVFNSGHKIRVSVSSSNYPRFDVNPNNGLPLSKNGTAIVAKNTLYMSSSLPSYLSLPVVQPSQVPPVNILGPVKEAVRRMGKGHILDGFVKDKGL